MLGRALSGVVGLMVLPAGMGANPALPDLKKVGRCQGVMVTGEVRAGEAYRTAIGGGLELALQPIASGWILRVIPVAGPLGKHDYAELATPPYHSVTPLSISTDFSFRAQDAIGWNPREFRFVTDRASYSRLLAVYDRLPGSGAGADPAVERELTGLLVGTGQGILRIVDARLIAGTADQWQTAAVVSSHFTSTAHTLDESGAASPLGKIEWMRFKVELTLPVTVSRGGTGKAGSRACDS